MYFALLFMQPYFNVLSGYFCVSLNSVTGSHSLNFDKNLVTAPLRACFYMMVGDPS